MRGHGKIYASVFLAGALVISAFIPAKAATSDSAKVLNVRSGAEHGSENPAMYARDDGTWIKNANDIWTYVDSSNQQVRNCWVKDGDMLFFVGYDGCLVKDNYSSDGFWLDADGKWDSTKTQRTWDVDPYEGAYEGAGNIWIFSLPRNGNMDSVKLAYMQTGEIYATCTLTSVGHGCFMAWPEGSNNVYEQMLISVSDDKNTVRISSNGNTDVCTYTPNSYYYDPSGQGYGQGYNNQSYNNQGYNNQGYNNQNYNNQGYNNQGYNNYNYNNGYNYDYNAQEDYNSQAYYEFVFPYSGIDVLEDWEIANLSDYELRIAINEIYARHGRRFKDKELQSYFNSLSWYAGIYDPEDFDKIQDSLLSETEKKNINKLVKERNKRK